MDTPSLVALIVTVVIIGCIFVGAVLFIKFTTRPRNEAVKAARTDAVMRVQQAEIMGVVDLHDGKLNELSPAQRLEYDKYQALLRAGEQARRDQAWQEGIYRGPSSLGVDAWRQGS